MCDCPGRKTLASKKAVPIECHDGRSRVRYLPKALSLGTAMRNEPPGHTALCVPVRLTLGM